MTQADQKIETKEHILGTALELFAQFGFDGTSVRQIAESANVNIAAVSYHFGSKHNLYWAAMNVSHNILKEEIKRLALISESTEDLIVSAFNFVINDNTHLFRATVKMMLAQGVPEPDPEYYDPSCEQGPPGMEFLALMIEKDFKMKIPPKDMEWAVRSIFGVLMHWCLICCTSKMKMIENKVEFLEINNIRLEMRRTVLAIKLMLKKDLAQ